MNSAITALEGLLNPMVTDDKFVEMHLDSVRSSYRWYKDIKDQKGVEAAETKLEKYVALEHLREFSGSIATIILGVMDLAKVDPNNKRVILIDDCSKLTYDIDYYMKDSPETKMVLAYNHPDGLLGCGCSGDHVTGERVWGTFDGKYGQLGLQAVIITFNGPLRIIDLVFPFRRNTDLPFLSHSEITLDGFSVVRLKQDGSLHSLESKLYAWKHSMCLLTSLGLIDQGKILRLNHGSGGSLEANLDLPGAYDYLAKHIPTLGEYFSGLAKKITEQAEKQKIK